MRACGCGCLWSPRRVAGRLSLSLKTAAIYSFLFHAHISKLQYSVVRRPAAMDGSSDIHCRNISVVGMGMLRERRWLPRNVRLGVHPS